MIRPKVLPNILVQANTEGIKTSLLANFEGSLLAVAGDDSKADEIAAISCNIWVSYEENGQELDILLIDCEQGTLAITRVSELILCLVGSEDVKPGLLKLKATSLRQYLEEPLMEVF
eukprot:TRINITY_DN1087_c0_g1_i1.p1 TRINITY_DN1087_c0_g1~~TRINITY_DN1087_c0_g1_i1.p1  ORF type:complete len:117 (-),score=43.22 TRINITY_DN1087_c0_g1_i1:282-632(-)